MNDVERILRVLHVEPGDRARRSADQIQLSSGGGAQNRSASECPVDRFGQNLRPIPEFRKAERAERETDALAYLTGDLSLLREDLRPDPLLMAMPQGGLTDEQQAAARQLALETLARFRDTGCQAAPLPSSPPAYSGSRLYEARIACGEKQRRPAEAHCACVGGVSEFETC